MIAYTLSALFTIGAVWLAVWLLMTGWVKLLQALDDRLEDSDWHLVSVDRDGLCSRGWHHTGCGCLLEDDAA